jgi:4-hydroxythreonine-4-phosphate dehydrogenase
VSARQVLAVTAGDPRGIGPEIIAKALADPRVRERCDVLVIGPSGIDLAVNEDIGKWKTGGSAGLAGRLAGLAIERAVELAQEGGVAGIVTAPIDKSALFEGGYDFPGHTEMLAELTDSSVAMMLASDKLRVVLATTHLPLRDAPDAVTAESISSTAEITRKGLRDWFGIAEPRIALCALNPHGGDNRRFGTEDEDILAPAARASNLAGPFPADTVFVRAMRGEFDAVIAPYHDVGMTAIKVASFGSAVNVTLGLPFPRTSPDHGTALDIAGKNVADASSFIAALLLCSEIATRARPRDGRPANADPPPANRSAGPPSRER